MKNTFETIDRDRLRGWMNNKKDFVLIDVLGSKSYEDKHLPGAINIPSDTKSFIKEVEKVVLEKNALVVVYCSSFDCQASPKAADKLAKTGYVNVYDFDGGLADWSDAGFPFERQGQLVYLA
ncbi:MAG: rhodanese-like domain-containing protein [Candidatus Colwellbacteria bacterium]